jgi:CubicO group peptidase (beta-lactamase class C family)
MKKKSTLSIFFLILLFSQTLFTQTRLEEADKLIQQLKEESESAGWSVTISIDDETVLSKGYGFANLENQTSVTPNKTKFRIGSISKALTSAALGVLMQEGKVDIDKPVQKYVPYFPYKQKTITTKMVAGHLAGIRHYKNDSEFLSSKRYKTMRESMEIFMYDSLVCEPSTAFCYSSFGYTLVSAVIEAAANKDFLKVMDEKVFQPLFMNETIADMNDSIIVFRAGFYSMEDGSIINAPYVDNSYKWAGGGFLSTTEDLVKFGNSMLNANILTEKTLSELITSQRTLDGKETGYGIGWFTGVNEFGRKYFGHAGGSIGGCGNLLIYPDKKLVLAVLTNDTHAKIGNDMHKVAEIFLKE